MSRGGRRHPRSRGWGDSLYPHVDERDVADVAVAALLGRVPSGSRLTLTGPEAISPRQQVAALAAAIGRPIDFVALTPAEAMARYRAEGWDDDSIEIERIVWEKGLVRPPRVRPAASAVLGRRPRSFADWAVDHRAAFGFTPVSGVRRFLGLVARCVCRRAPPGGRTLLRTGGALRAGRRARHSSAAGCIVRVSSWHQP